jgi:ubiquinone/menaquinone biosynthesis C-methylase UbiE
MNQAYGVTLSAAATAFDRVASSYDELFTHTAIGRAQRRQVWGRLLAAFPAGSRILELNCGTGEDAWFLANRGRTVLACDASATMIEVAKRKSRTEPDARATDLRFLQLANEELSTLPTEETFDGALSNFSGMNCVSDLRFVARDLAKLIRPGGNVLLCVWSRVCLVEVIWYLLNGQAKKAVRRFSREHTARLGDAVISVSYPSMREMRRAFSPWFALTSRQAVGLFVPPSYMERSIGGREKLLARLEQLDRLLAGWPILRELGDHVLLEFVRCNP